jgi:hypothetical protein
MQYILKREIETNNPPAPDQLDVGEIVINAKTGIMYSKRTDGKVVKFMSIAIDDCSPGNDITRFAPVITHEDLSTFCCNGDVLTITVNNLLANNEYSYRLFDTITGSSVYFDYLSTSFQTAEDALYPTDSSTRTVSINTYIFENQKNALLKFSVLKNGVVLAETMIPICCASCS